MRRRVVVAQELFDQLETQLPEDAGGVLPSQAQFIARDLIVAIGAFGERWDELPRMRGLEDFRILISAGTLVAAFSIVGVLRSDGVIELVRISVDNDRLVDPEEPEE